MPANEKLSVSEGCPSVLIVGAPLKRHLQDFRAEKKGLQKKQGVGQGMKEKIVGIIGGLGPEATVDLMRRVIQATPASDDQDHIRMIVDCNPKVPSRMKAILEGTGEDPAPYLVIMAKDLAAWGADFLAIACNTAHLYLGPDPRGRSHSGAQHDRFNGRSRWSRKIPLSGKRVCWPLGP